MNGASSCDWDKRYRKGGLRAPGTFAHTEAGNAQFYRAKCDALDRCMHAIGSSFTERRILDAAGGSGQFLPYYLRRGARHVTVADYSQVALQIVRNQWKDNSNIEVVFMDLTRYLPELSQSPYDVVLVQEAIFLLPDDDALRNTIGNLARYLRPGGYLFISDVFPEARVVASPYVVRRPRCMFEGLLAQNDLETVVYIPQTALFNRSLFGRAQLIVERIGSLYYWMDRVAQRQGITFLPGEDIKYLIARKKTELPGNG